MRSPKTRNTPVRVWLWFTPTQAVLAAFVACAEVFSVWGIDWHLVNTGGWGLLSKMTPGVTFRVVWGIPVQQTHPRFFVPACLGSWSCLNLPLQEAT